MSAQLPPQFFRVEIIDQHRALGDTVKQGTQRLFYIRFSAVKALRFTGGAFYKHKIFVFLQTEIQAEQPKRRKRRAVFCLRIKEQSVPAGARKEKRFLQNVAVGIFPGFFVVFFRKVGRPIQVARNIVQKPQPAFEAAVAHGAVRMQIGKRRFGRHAPVPPILFSQPAELFFLIDVFGLKISPIRRAPGIHLAVNRLLIKYRNDIIQRQKAVFHAASARKIDAFRHFPFQVVDFAVNAPYAVKPFGRGLVDKGDIKIGFFQKVALVRAVLGKRRQQLTEVIRVEAFLSLFVNRILAKGLIGQRIGRTTDVCRPFPCL